MRHIFNDSGVKWSITCNYNTEGVVLTDSVRVAVNSFNPLTKNDGGCVQVEYINIKGYDCFGCEAYVFQRNNRPLHFRPRRSRINCDFDITGLKECDDMHWEQSFGYYRCINSEHRCSSSPDSTTQTWFG